MNTKSVTFKFDQVEEVRRLPGCWLPADFRRLLETLDVDDFESYSEADLEEVALMALQDVGIDEATSVILSNFTEDRFSKGQIRNLCNELREDRCWEEYADLAHQKALYTSVDVLSLAFPYDYAEPDATQVDLRMTAGSLVKSLGGRSLDAATLLRGVSLCQEKDSILNRFFSDQIAGTAFPEAEHVLWHVEQTRDEPDALDVKFWGSSYWFEDVEEDVEVTCKVLWPEV